MESSKWTPPNNPNPHELLYSAVSDNREGLFEQSLAKFVWFHHHALEFDTHLSAVRGSFALGYWWDLATVYAPAAQAFIETRDAAEAAFRENPDFRRFQDVASLNRQLGTGNRTAELFVDLASRDEDAARALYHVAESYLIEGKQFLECGPFLEVEERLGIAVHTYRLTKQSEDSRGSSEIPIPKLARKRYVKNVTALVGLLVLNDRMHDASNACCTALEVVDDEDFRTTLAAAMNGEFPADLT